MSASTGLAEPVTNRSELRVSIDSRTLDQTAPCDDEVFSASCDGQVSSRDSSQSNNDISTGDGQVQHSNVMVDSTEKEENENFNAVLSSKSDQNNADKSTNATGDEQDRSTKGSEVQTVGSTSIEDSAKDGNTVGSKETSCPDCEKLRQQKEKPFLSKSKSCSKYVWNRYLLRGFEGAVHPDWILHIVNGFVGQSGILSVVYSR